MRTTNQISTVEILVPLFPEKTHRVDAFLEESNFKFYDQSVPNVRDWKSTISLTEIFLGFSGAGGSSEVISAWFFSVRSLSVPQPQRIWNHSFRSILWFKPKIRAGFESCQYFPVQWDFVRNYRISFQCSNSTSEFLIGINFCVENWKFSIFHKSMW